jgi:hypothetical protein
MIVFDLQCGQGHRFEAWFGSSADYDSQQQRQLIACPFCDDTAVTKAVMAPAVPAKSNQRDGRQPMAAGGGDAEAMAQLLALQRQLEAQSEYVGDRLAAEARALHRAGETRSIHGEATLAEARALAEDGVPLLPLPFRPRARLDG